MESTVEDPGERGQGGGKDRPPTHCLVGQGAGLASCLTAGASRLRDTFQIHRAASGHSQEALGPAICGDVGASWTGRSGPASAPPVLHYSESHIPRTAYSEGGVANPLSCSENK